MFEFVMRGGDEQHAAASGHIIEFVMRGGDEQHAAVSGHIIECALCDSAARCRQS